jgi:hypothetical protein
VVRAVISAVECKYHILAWCANLSANHDIIAALVSPASNAASAAAKRISLLRTTPLDGMIERRWNRLGNL